jgi:hypothetical protein
LSAALRLLWIGQNNRFGLPAFGGKANFAAIRAESNNQGSVFPVFSYRAKTNAQNRSAYGIIFIFASFNEIWKEL